MFASLCNEKEKQKKYKKRNGNEREKKLLFVLNLKLDFISKLSMD